MRNSLKLLNALPYKVQLLLRSVPSIIVIAIAGHYQFAALSGFVAFNRTTMNISMIAMLVAIAVFVAFLFWLRRENDSGDQEDLHIRGVLQAAIDAYRVHCT